MLTDSGGPMEANSRSGQIAEPYRQVGRLKISWARESSSSLCMILQEWVWPVLPCKDKAQCIFEIKQTLLINSQVQQHHERRVRAWPTWHLEGALRLVLIVSAGSMLQQSSLTVLPLLARIVALKAIHEVLFLHFATSRYTARGCSTLMQWSISL